MKLTKKLALLLAVVMTLCAACGDQGGNTPTDGNGGAGSSEPKPNAAVTDKYADKDYGFQQEMVGDTCVCCGKPAHQLVYWGKAY